MPKHILVVDDDADIRQAAEMVLTSAGYKVSFAASAEEAMQKLQADGADLVLLDLARIWNPSSAEADIYSTLVYSGSPENVHSVMIDGRWVYRNASFVALDERKTVHDARKQWVRRLRRMER